MESLIRGSEWIALILGVFLLAEFLNYVKFIHEQSKPKTPPVDGICFDDFERGKAYRRRYVDGKFEVALQILPTTNPLNTGASTYAIVVELMSHGTPPPDCIFFWLDSVEWPLAHDGKSHQLGIGKYVAEYYGLVEESPDPSRAHPPVLKRIPHKGD